MLSRILVALGVALVVPQVVSAIPAEVTLRAPAKLEILNAGKPGGMVLIKPGEKLDLVEVADPYVIVRYRNLTGRVFRAQTDLAEKESPAAGKTGPAAAPVVAPAVESPPTVSAPVEPPPPAAAHVPGTAFERTLTGKLVLLQGGGLKPMVPSRLAGVKFYAVYFSASWCGPCKAFTPELVDAYGKIRSMYPEFEVVLVNRDRSAAAMLAYMREDAMPWPAIEWNATKGAAINRYSGGGIPCLVLVDENGKVLSDSYRWGRYVGPHTVLDDTWKILKEYRKKNPRPKV